MELEEQRQLAGEGRSAGKCHIFLTMFFTLKSADKCLSQVIDVCTQYR